jgi:hypothetical protein
LFSFLQILFNTSFKLSKVYGRLIEVSIQFHFVEQPPTFFITYLIIIISLTCFDNEIKKPYFYLSKAPDCWIKDTIHYLCIAPDCWRSLLK